MSNQIDINPLSIASAAISLLSIAVVSWGITDAATKNAWNQKFERDVLKKQVQILNSNHYKPIDKNNPPPVTNKNSDNPHIAIGNSRQEPVNPTPVPVNPIQNPAVSIENLARDTDAERFSEESAQLERLYRQYALIEQVPTDFPRSIQISYNNNLVRYNWQTTDLYTFLQNLNSILTGNEIRYIRIPNSPDFDLSNRLSLRSVYNRLNAFRRRILINSIQHQANRT